MGNVRKYTLRLYPGQHDRLIAAMESVQKQGRGRLQATLVEALESWFFRDASPDTKAPSGPPVPPSSHETEDDREATEMLARALVRVLAMPAISAEALAAAEHMAHFRRLYAALPRPEDLSEIDAPLVVEAARLLLERAAAFYRDHPIAEQPEPIRSFLKRYLALIEEDEA